MDLETRRKLKELGLKPVLSNQGEYYNCNDVTNFFKEIIKENKTLREYVQGKCIQGLSDKPCDNKMCSGCALLKELSPYTI